MKNRNLNILPEKAKNDMIGVVELLADTTSDMLSNVDFDKGNFHVAIYINDDLKKQKEIYHFSIEYGTFELSFYGEGNVKNGEIELITIDCNASYNGINYSFLIESNTSNHINFLQNFSDNINQFHTTQIFLQDYQRIFRKNPLSYIKDLVDTNLFEWNITENINNEEPENLELIKYTGTFGEEVFELGYQQNEKEFYNSYINICVGEHMEIHINQIPDEKIMNLIYPCQKNVITVEDIVVRTSQSFITHHQHNLEFVHAHICMHKEFKMFEVLTDAYYCKECDRYFMLERDFIKLSHVGAFGCRVITESTYLSASKTNNYASWNEQSVLRAYGYTVNKTDNLSPAQRQSILMFIYKNSIMQLERMISLIEWFMDRHRANDCIDARRKWQEDIDFLKEQRDKLGTYRDIMVRNIYIKQRHYNAD